MHLQGRDYACTGKNAILEQIKIGTYRLQTCMFYDHIHPHCLCASLLFQIILQSQAHLTRKSNEEKKTHRLVMYIIPQ